MHARPRASLPLYTYQTLCWRENAPVVLLPGHDAVVVEIKVAAQRGSQRGGEVTDALGVLHQQVDGEVAPAHAVLVGEELGPEVRFVHDAGAEGAGGRSQALTRCIQGIPTRGRNPCGRRQRLKGHSLTQRNQRPASSGCIKGERVSLGIEKWVQIASTGLGRARTSLRVVQSVRRLRTGRLFRTSSR